MKKLARSKKRSIHAGETWCRSVLVEVKFVTMDVAAVRTASRILLALAISILGAGAGSAQSIGQILARSGLVQDDINVMVRAGSSLYSSGNARVGDDVIWSNPATGAFGMAEIVETSGNCVRVAYRFRARGQERTRTITTRRCLVENRWVLSD